MLFIRRVMGQTVCLGDDIEIVVLNVGERGVTLGLTAPSHVRISRGDLHRAQTSTIGPHVDAFEESLTAVSAEQTSLIMTRIRRIIEDCHFGCLADISSPAVHTCLQSIRKSDDLGHRTGNQYLQAMYWFCNWCVSTKRLLVNPLPDLERLNRKVDQSHKRRILSTDEVGRLVASARESGESIQGFDGEKRARIYILSFLTGLMRSEIASLTPCSFVLDAVLPTVTIEANSSTRKRRDVLPLHPELVSLLRDWLKGLSPTERLFPNLEKRRTWLMLKNDLQRVGIPYENEDGVADFHAAGRQAHITELLRIAV